MNPAARPPGNPPEIDARPWVAAPPAPLELPRLVMRGALIVVAIGLLLALVLGLWRARQDMRDELRGALALARASATLSDARARSDAELVAALEALRGAGGTRHLELRVTDAGGRVLIEPPVEPEAPAPLRALVAINQVLFAPPPRQTVTARVPRPTGADWQVEWVASHDSEQREALAQLLETMSLLAGCGALMLLVMGWHLKRSFRPLGSLLSGIARVEQQDLSALRSLPTMPIRELDAMAQALRHLAEALAQAEAQRRVLAAQVQSLQEDERGHLARELHDEFGQWLTALRVDAAWLQRRLAAQPELAAVAVGMGEQCQRIQQEVRALLTRLRPLGPGEGGEAGATENVARLRGLLEALVQSWAQSPSQATRYTLHFETKGVADDQPLPRELVLAVYRISQEALTNVARHAQARSARLSLRLERLAGHGGVEVAEGMLHWSVVDDGRGLRHPGAMQHGNGLAGVKERIWAAGGDLECQPADPAAARTPGLLLRAQLPLHLPTETPLVVAPA